MQLEEFVDANGTAEGSDGFRKVNKRLLEIPFEETVTLKAGTMIAYIGDVTFTGKSSAEGGLTGFVKEAVSGEGTPIMKAEGNGTLYAAEQSKKVQILSLGSNESISVNGTDVLAFEKSVNYEISTVGGLSQAAAGGLTNVFLTGPGDVAITTHGDPVTMRPPVTTDPDATVAWSADLSPTIETNKTIEIGQTSGEQLQMRFTGPDGFVIVQPHEEGGQM